MYIYLDAEAFDDTGTDARKPSVPDQGRLGDEGSKAAGTDVAKRGISDKGNVISLTTLANASAIFAAIGLGIYVIGMLSLLMPIRRAFTHDWSVAWYAVAVLPKTVAAGQGAALLAAFMSYYVVGLVVCTLLVGEITLGFRVVEWVGLRIRQRPAHERRPQSVELLDKPRQKKKILRQILSANLPPYARQMLRKHKRQVILSFLLIAISSVLLLDQYNSVKPPSQSVIERLTSHEMILSIIASIYLLTCYFGFELMAAALERRRGRLVPSLRKRRLFWGGAGIILVSAFFTAGLSTTLEEPRLPAVEITKTNSANNGNSVVLDGHLLAHTDRFWYVFEDEGQQRGIMIAIPDDDVKTVHVLPMDQ